MAFWPSSARWAKALKPNLLTMSNKAFLEALDNRNRQTHQTTRYPAICAGKMGMALLVGALIGQFIMPRPLVKVRPVDQTRFQEPFQYTINGDTVRSRGAEPSGDLLRRLRPVHTQQNSQNLYSRDCPPKLR